ncbi:MAG: hypothetical protein CBB79_08740 [Synechococcus sp. TMED19]|nr:MAG: hypothetical protein CBB79_08740 [Synechococcus sp. TMED19]
MTAAPLRLPLQALQRAVAQVAQAPLQLASWSLGWTFALQLASWLPLPLLLQVAVQLIGLTVAVAGLLALSERSLDPWQFSWRGFLTPLKRAPLPLLLLPLLMGSLIALAGLAFVLPGLMLLLFWSFSLPLLVDQGGEAWEVMASSTVLIRRHWRRLLPSLLLLWGLTLLAALLSWWLLGLWLPLAAVLLQGLYRSAQG